VLGWAGRHCGGRAGCRQAAVGYRDSGSAELAVGLACCGCCLLWTAALLSSAAGGGGSGASTGYLAGWPVGWVLCHEGPSGWVADMQGASWAVVGSCKGCRSPAAREGDGVCGYSMLAYQQEVVMQCAGLCAVLLWLGTRLC
jgi:hypothetical protein